MMSLKRRRPSVGAAPVLVWAYIAAVIALAVTLGIWGWKQQPLASADLLPLALLSGMAVLGASLPEVKVGPVGITFTSVVIVATIALVGPFGAVVVGAVCWLGAVTRLSPRSRLFNAAMLGSMGGIGGLVYLLAGGLIPVAQAHGPTELLLRVGLPLTIANVVLNVANAYLLAGIVRLSNGVPVRRVVLGMLSETGPAAIGYGLIGFLLVILWQPADVGWFSAVLVLAPLFVARWAYEQYGDERRVHERTVAALVAAVEVNNPYTRGHSERMAALSSLISQSLSLSMKRGEALQFAALLHDVGTISLPWQTLRKGAPLTDADLAAIQNHPATGLAMVGEIDFLQGSFEGILHHHERFDGRGYPDRLAGKQIPELARVLAVADAFDSMTTSRSYRSAMSVQASLDELRARAGTQFDPDIVAALEQALEGTPWQPTVLASEVLATAGDAHDHDDPMVSDLIAARLDPQPASAAGHFQVEESR